MNTSGKLLNKWYLSTWNMKDLATEEMVASIKGAIDEEIIKEIEAAANKNTKDALYRYLVDNHRIEKERVKLPTGEIGDYAVIEWKEVYILLYLGMNKFMGKIKMREGKEEFVVSWRPYSEWRDILQRLNREAKRLNDHKA